MFSINRFAIINKQIDYIIVWNDIENIDIR